MLYFIVFIPILGLNQALWYHSALNLGFYNPYIIPYTQHLIFSYTSSFTKRFNYLIGVNVLTESIFILRLYNIYDYFVIIFGNNGKI